ncbi:hypothetical protein Ga0466249_004104 [Sporomusaceae bacterium BoRhaA]|nr:hypothetical protein [Pelorhabdus rhamnosifermentans]
MLTSKVVGSFPDVALVRLNETINRNTALVLLHKTQALSSAKAFIKHTLEWKKAHKPGKL